ncbi:hypothetical protein LL037_21050 [Clostridium estertheticum]|uniref:hypothetical protein n=1 Tax=Clostridium estertheticum TaxID=238834 RepID=UPI001C0C77D0|nr:hypothetical protein [Clostridium estertheticum]MBU3200614.1 hypothetical protein [Clostridium estertheticum]WAG64925.1 hypothetical protein LL037_21050 [Clostridium estertheticum]
MSRMSHAKYRNFEEPVSAIDIDENYNSYNEEERKHFKCIFCNSQVQFSRGKSHDDPHFKNWPNMNHKDSCIVQNAENQKYTFKGDVDLEVLVSTILPRSMRLNSSSTTTYVSRGKRAKRFGGKTTQKFIYQIKNLLDPKNKFNIKTEYKELKLLVEDGTQVSIKDIIKTQDEIIDIIDQKDCNEIICILRGTISKPLKRGTNYVIPMTKGNNSEYKNSKSFNLFINYEYVQKNVNSLDKIKDSLIICYGIAEKTQYGYQMELFSIKNQVELLRKF